MRLRPFTTQLRVCCNLMGNYIMAAEPGHYEISRSVNVSCWAMSTRMWLITSNNPALLLWPCWGLRGTAETEVLFG